MGITFGTPSEAELLQLVLDKRSRHTGVALPGTIVSYDAVSGTCSVDPGVWRLVPSIHDPDEDEVEPLPTLTDVPVCWLVGRGIQVKATLQPGDTVLLVCLDRDPSGWLDTGKPSEPDDARMHSWASAVAIPGLVPNTSPFPEPSDAAALASKLDKLISIISTATAAPVETGLASIILAINAPPPVGLGASTPGFTTGSSVLKLDEPGLLP